VPGSTLTLEQRSSVQSDRTRADRTSSWTSLVKSAIECGFGVRKLVSAGSLVCLYMYADRFAIEWSCHPLFGLVSFVLHCLGVSQRTSDPEHGDGVGYRSTRLALPSVLDSSARNKRPPRLMACPLSAAFELKSGQQPWHWSFYHSGFGGGL